MLEEDDEVGCLISERFITLPKDQAMSSLLLKQNHLAVPLKRFSLNGIHLNVKLEVTAMKAMSQYHGG